MTLRSDTVLAVQFTENGGLMRTLIFVALSVDVNDIIAQETDRREALFDSLYARGPVFTSANYGTLTLSQDGRFTWTGNNLLIPQIIPNNVLGSGTVLVRLFLASSMTDRYDGAFSLRFDGIGGPAVTVNFMYITDGQGFRIEYVPPENLDGVTVIRRASSPMVIYFFRAETQGAAVPPPSGRYSVEF
jgi:hypothetical protein